VAYNCVNGANLRQAKAAVEQPAWVRAIDTGSHRNCVGRSGDRPTPPRDLERTDSHVYA